MLEYYLEFVVIIIIFAVFSLFSIRFMVRNKKSKKARVVLVVWSVVVALLLAEVYLRFFYFRSDAFGALSRNFELKYYRYDSYGFRDSRLPLSLSKRNIVVLGDSVVLGHGIKNPDFRFSNILRKKMPQYHVVNMGRKAASTNDEVVFLLENHLEGAKTDFVFLNYFFNDIEDSIPREEVTKIFKTNNELRQFLQKIILFTEVGKHLVMQVLNIQQQTLQKYLKLLSDSYQSRAVLERHQQSLKVLKYVVENLYRARPVVLIWPFFKKTDRSCYEVMRKAFDRLGVETIDLITVFKRYDVDELVVNSRDLHPNEYANQIVADLICEFLKKSEKD